MPYLKPGGKVLDIGSGSGYLVAVLHELVSPAGKVVGIDHIPELVQDSVSNLKKDGRENTLENGEIEMIAGDGRKGYAAGGQWNIIFFPSYERIWTGPYDAIHVGAAAPTMPQALIDQLASPGRMFIPVGVGAQYIEHVDKDENGKITRSRVMAVRVSI